MSTGRVDNVDRWVDTVDPVARAGHRGRCERGGVEQRRRTRKDRGSGRLALGQVWVRGRCTEQYGPKHRCGPELGSRSTVWSNGSTVSTGGWQWVRWRRAESRVWSGGVWVALWVERCGAGAGTVAIRARGWVDSGDRWVHSVGQWSEGGRRPRPGHRCGAMVASEPRHGVGVAGPGADPGPVGGGLTNVGPDHVVDATSGAGRQCRPAWPTLSTGLVHIVYRLVDMVDRAGRYCRQSWSTVSTVWSTLSTVWPTFRST